jgi:hypothetical protein
MVVTLLRTMVVVAAVLAVKVKAVTADRVSLCSAIRLRLQLSLKSLF